MGASDVDGSGTHMHASSMHPSTPPWSAWSHVTEARGWRPHRGIEGSGSRGRRRSMVAAVMNVLAALREPSWGIVVISIIVVVPLVAMVMLAIVNVNELVEWCSCHHRRAGW